MSARPRLAVSVYLATSLDGFIAAEDGGLDWLGAVSRPDEDYGYAAFFGGVDTLVVGRATYDTVRTFDAWPYAGKRVVVLTHRPIDAAHGEEAASGPLLPLLERLAVDGSREVYVDGGAVVRQALAEGCVDRLTISVVPVLLGRGRPLFGPDVPPSDWRLLGAEPYASGLVQLRYARAST